MCVHKEFLMDHCQQIMFFQKEGQCNNVQLFNIKYPSFTKKIPNCPFPCKTVLIHINPYSKDNTFLILNPQYSLIPPNSQYLCGFSKVSTSLRRGS